MQHTLVELLRVYQEFELVRYVKVRRHIRTQHAFYHPRTSTLLLFSLHVGKDVVLCTPKQFVCKRAMVVLQYRNVVVQHGEWRLRIDVETVVQPVVIDVVHKRRNQKDEDVQGLRKRSKAVQSWRSQNPCPK